MKAVNYRVGAIKRKYKLGKNDFKPGDIINKINQKEPVLKAEKVSPKEKISIMGLV